MDFSRLPGAGQEARDVVGVWEMARDETDPPANVVLLTGVEASDAAFKASATGKRVLHLATHGFFLGGRCRSALDPQQRGVGGLAPAKPGMEPEETPSDGTHAEATTNPLLLSGLALAGANHREHAGPGEEDGILTAEEIAAMDLSGVEWAVLSACDTGVGEIRAGEGVFGLRRAFQVAGARTLIMSLWSVEDESAREWMRALYEGRLQEGMNTADAVRHASLTVLNARRENGQGTHPFYWAGFVAAGDWR